MNDNPLYRKIKQFQAMAERCHETHRGDGLAEIGLELCKLLLEVPDGNDLPDAVPPLMEVPDGNDLPDQAA